MTQQLHNEFKAIGYLKNMGSHLLSAIVENCLEKEMVYLLQQRISEFLLTKHAFNNTCSKHNPTS